MVLNLILLAHTHVLGVRNWIPFDEFQVQHPILGHLKYSERIFALIGVLILEHLLFLAQKVLENNDNPSNGTNWLHLQKFHVHLKFEF